MSISIDGVRLDWPEQTATSRSPRRGTPHDVPAPPTEPSAEIAEPGPSPFERLIRAVGARIEEGERIVADAKSGYTSLDAAELIALQAGIYRYSEAIDLSAKLVDRATSAVRTVLSGGQ